MWYLSNLLAQAENVYLNMYAKANYWQWNNGLGIAIIDIDEKAQAFSRYDICQTNLRDQKIWTWKFPTKMR